jgi:hypothetical protein
MSRSRIAPALSFNDNFEISKKRLLAAYVLLVRDQIDQIQLPHPFWDQFANVLSHRESNLQVLSEKSLRRQKELRKKAIDSSTDHMNMMKQAKEDLDNYRSLIHQCEAEIESERSTRPYDSIREETLKVNAEIDYLTRSVARRRRVVSDLKDQLQYHITKLNLDQDSFDTRQRKNRNHAKELAEGIGAVQRKLRDASRDLEELKSREAACGQLVRALSPKRKAAL